jgi:glycosyltransferase involved in cell wall biosynthesis
VIVCTRHRPDQLGRCLAALARLEGPNPELIVVDNTHGDPQAELLASRAGARYVVEPEVRLSRARNRGIEEATTDVIAFLDDDALADPDWLLRHSEALADESLMASTGRVLPINLENGRGMLDLGEETFVVDRSDPWWFERTNFGGLAPGGSNIAVKRQAFEGGLRFNESLGLGTDLAGFEEHYFLFTLVKTGARVAYVPGAVIRHPDPELLTESHGAVGRRAYRITAAYLTMLLVEEPEFRSRTMRYAVRGFRRKPVPWRDSAAPSRLAMLAAGPRGSLLYLRSRLTRR